MGVSGTTNYWGQLFTESNPALLGDRGYGLPGVRGWGAWEKLVRTDCAVAAALDMVVAPLRDAEWNIEPSPVPVAGAAAHVEFLRWNLHERMDPPASTLAEQMSRGFLTYGFSIHEAVQTAEPHPLAPGGVAICVDKMAQRLPSTLEYNGWIEVDGELSEVRQRGVRDGRYVTNVSLAAERILLASWNREGNNYQGYSAFRPVWYICQIREHLLRILGIGHQREALGIPVAEVDINASLTPGERQRLRRVLENVLYHENAAVVLPPGVKLQWLWSPGANKGHVVETWKCLGLAVLEVMQSQQMALGTGDTGSRAVGEVHDVTKNAFINGVKATLESVLNGVGRRPYAGLARKMLSPNFGELPAYPRIKLALPTSSLPPKEFVGALAQALGAGLVTWTSHDENRVRAALGLSTLAPEIRTQLKDAAHAQAQAQMQRTDDSETDDEKAAGSNPPSSGRPAPAVAAGALSRRGLTRDAAGMYIPRRTLFAWEKHLDWGGMDGLFETAKEAFEAAVRPMLVEALVAVMPQVKEAMADADPSEVAGLELPLSRVSGYVDDFLRDVYTQGRRHVAEERKRQPEAVEDARAQGAQPGVIGKPSTLAALAGAARASRVEFAKRRRPRAELDVERLLRAQRDVLLRRMRARTIDALQREAINKVRTGGDPADIVADVVTDALESRALRQDAASVVGQAFNVGRDEYARENGDSIRSVTLSAVLDEVTCEYCERMDGQSFAFDSPEHDAHVPPLTQCEGRDRCRCVLVYSFDDEGGSPGFRVVETYPENNEPREGD